MTLEEKLIRDAILLHLQSGERPNPSAWKAFRKSAEALWQSDTASVKSQAADLAQTGSEA